ncbi:MAG: metal-dependent hydrolase [Candidatus Micrarchaeota archaeon]
MRADTHVFQAILIALLISPIFTLDSSIFKLSIIGASFMQFLFGIFLGSFYPDTDVTESRIFRMKQINRKIPWQRTYKEYQELQNTKSVVNMFLFIYSSILMLFANILRYMVYYPTLYIVKLLSKKLAKEYEVSDEHRGISHTIPGIIISVPVLIICLILLNMLLGFVFNFNPFSSLLVIGIGFFIGGVVHLLQDSISKAGVRLFYPLNNFSIQGEYSSFDDTRNDATVFSVLLIISLFVTFYFTTISIPTYGKTIQLLASSFFPIIILIADFGILYRNTRVSYG